MIREKERRRDPQQAAMEKTRRKTHLYNVAGWKNTLHRELELSTGTVRTSFDLAYSNLDPISYKLRDELFNILESNLGEGNMTLQKIVDAITKGIGAERGLALQARANDENCYWLKKMVPDEVYNAILRYKPRRET